MSRYVLQFRDEEGLDKNRTGGKGKELTAMTLEGAPVAPGFNVLTEAFSDSLIYNGLDKQLEALTSQIDTTDLPALNRLAEEIREKIVAMPIPPHVEREILTTFRKLDGRVAVRSSGVSEDSEDTSFAGQNDTFLGIQGEDAVLDRIKACWASVYNPRAIVYRHKNGLGHLHVGLAVCVQQMVESEFSFVMFTKDPSTGNPNKVIIEVVRGLGEILVSGESNADYYEIDKRDLDITIRRFGYQDRQIVMRAEGGTRTIPVDTKQRNEWKLPDSTIKAIAREGIDLEKSYGAGLDIEGAVEDGKIWVLQRRPITTSKEYVEDEPAPEEDSEIISNDGLGAVPGVALGRVRVVEEFTDWQDVQDGEIVATKFTTPDCVEYMFKTGGIITEIGGKNSHAGIVMRESGIPVIVGVRNALKRFQNGELVTIDGAHGVIYRGRAEATLAWGERRLERLKELKIKMAQVKTKTQLGVIVNDPAKAVEIAALNVDYIALGRIETALPREDLGLGYHPRYALENGLEEQYITAMAENVVGAYAEAFGPDRDVVIRFMDYKTNELEQLRGAGDHEAHEENPMLGERGAHRYIKYPREFQMECEAIRRVIFDMGHRNVIVMVPFVRSPEELEQVIALAESFGLRRDQGVRYWMMVELPTNVIRIEDFIDKGIVGISIGSNDLTQLTLGADRENASLAHFDERDPAVVWLMVEAIKRAKKRGIYTSLCGNAINNHPELAEVLREAGIDSIGVEPNMVDQLRQILYRAEQKEAATAA